MVTSCSRTLSMGRRQIWDPVSSMLPLLRASRCCCSWSCSSAEEASKTSTRLGAGGGVLAAAGVVSLRLFFTLAPLSFEARFLGVILVDPGSSDTTAAGAEDSASPAEGSATIRRCGVVEGWITTVISSVAGADTGLWREELAWVWLVGEG